MTALLDKIKSEYEALKADGHTPKELQCGLKTYTAITRALDRPNIDLQSLLNKSKTFEPPPNSLVLKWNGNDDDGYELI